MASCPGIGIIRQYRPRKSSLRANANLLDRRVPQLTTTIHGIETIKDGCRCGTAGVGPRSFHRRAAAEIKRGIDVMHRLLMLSMTLAFSSVTVTPGRAADRRPNVLFIA